MVVLHYIVDLDDRRCDTATQAAPAWEREPPAGDGQAEGRYVTAPICGGGGGILGGGKCGGGGGGCGGLLSIAYAMNNNVITYHVTTSEI